MKILVSGLINIETTLRVEGFPIPYAPVHYPFWGVNATVSGVGYNLAKALTTLGDRVPFLSLIGRGLYEPLVRAALQADGIAGEHVRADVAQTAQSVILYDSTGRRQINVDLKDLQEQVYPLEQFEIAVQDCALAALCNINYSRPLLEAARRHGVPVATDVHTIGDLEDDYNRDFMAAADVLFMSNEALPVAPETWAQQVMARYGPQVLVIGLGAQGALLAERDRGMTRVPAVDTRPIVNTIGAGDALFAAFLHFYTQGHTAHAALRRATVFASYKIGERGAAEGFLTEAELERWYRKVYSA